MTAASAARLARASTIVSIVVFALLWAHQSGKPLQLDDVDHFGIAKAISESGKPIYYRGEDLPTLSGALHPPLNDYLLAGWFRIFGVGFPQARSFALLFTLLHGAVVLLLMRCLWPGAVVERVAPYFWALFLLNPYTLQMSSMVDIDSSTYGPVLALLLWSVIRLSWRGGARRDDPPALWELGLVMLLVAACLWTKLTTVLLAIPFIYLLLAARLKGLRALATAVVTVGLGIVLFLVSFWLCCSAWGLDPNTTLQFVYATATGGGRLATRTDTLLFMARHLARWTGWLPWFAVGAALVITLREAIRQRRDAEAPSIEMLLLLGLATASTLYYCLSRLTFGNAPFKYTFVYQGILMVPLAYLASRSLIHPSDEPQAGSSLGPRGTSWERGLSYGIAFAAGLLLTATILGDSVVQHGWTARAVWLLCLPALAGGVALVATLLGPDPARRPAQVVLQLAVLFHLGAQLGVAAHQSRASYSTTYDYGQRGLAEAAGFVRSRTDANDVISSMKDMGLLAGRRYIENYGAIYGGPVQARRLIDAWEAGRVRFIVFTEGLGQDQVAVQPLLRDWVAARARLVASFGHYRIYDPRPAPS